MYQHSLRPPAQSVGHFGESPIATHMYNACEGACSIGDFEVIDIEIIVVLALH